MNTVKRRWPDLLIGVLVLLLLAGFATLLLGKNGPGRTQTGVVQSADTGTQSGSAQEQSGSSEAAQTPATQTPSARTPSSTTPTQSAGTQATGGGTSSSSTSSNAIPTIPAAPVTNSAGTGTGSANTGTSPATDGTTTETQQTQPSDTPAQTTTPVTTTTEPVARSGGAVATSETRTPTRNDYRISLGSYADASALQATTAGVSKLGYTVYPIAVASGVVAQVGPFATREAAAQALADIQRALPRALLYPPRNAPASTPSATGNAATSTTSTATTTTPATDTSSAQTAPTTGTAAPSSTQTPTGTQLAASGPVYLQVGAYNSTTAAQTAVARVRDLGLEPSVNAPSGRLVTVVVGPFEGQALTAAEAKLQAGGIDSFRVR